MKSIFSDMAAAYCALHFRSLDDESRRHVHGFAAFMAEQTGAGDAPAEAPRVETVTYADGTQATGTPPLPADSPAGPLPGPLEEQQQPELPPVEVVIMPPAAGQAEQPSATAGA